MTQDPLKGKIRKAILTLQIANGIAALAFLGGWFVSQESLFLIASACMVIAFIGLFFLKKRILSSLFPTDSK